MTSPVSSILDSFNPLKEQMFTVLNDDGSTNEYDPKLSRDSCLAMYRNMLTSRLMDDKAFKMQRSGQMGTFAQTTGQEGCQSPIALLVEKEDWVVPAFREQCLLISLGTPMHKFFEVYMGNESGNSIQGHVLPVSIPVGSHPLHAVGIAWAANIRKEKITVFTFFGDGATSEGDFHEAMNFAGVFNTPVIFICQNNQYAISTRREEQTKSKTIAQKANAYGFKGILVDGNDPLAVYAAIREAKAHTRAGKGPLLVEMYTYRLGPHTTSDDPTLYRDDQEVAEWKKKDPLTRFEQYLTRQGWLRDEQKKKFIEEAQQEIERAISEAKQNHSKPSDIFTYTYAQMTPALKEQYEYLKRFIDNKQDSHDKGGSL